MSDAREAPDWSGRLRAFWLPPTGTGNGLPARAWALIADLDDAATVAMLAACAAHGIAAFASERRRFRTRRVDHPIVYGVWVDSEHYSTAAEVLRSTLVAVRAKGGPPPVAVTAPRSGRRPRWRRTRRAGRG